MPDAIVNRLVALDVLEPHPDNYNRHPESQVLQLAASLKRFGFVESIAVQEGAGERYLIVSGHGIVEAAKRIVSGQVEASDELKVSLTQIRADIIPADWSPTQIKGYLIAANNRNSEPDSVMLARLLDEQREQGFEIESLGYDNALLDALLAENFPPDLFNLEEEHGDPDETMFWPRISLKLDPDTYAKYQELLAHCAAGAAAADDEAAHFTALIGEAHALIILGATA